MLKFNDPQDLLGIAIKNILDNRDKRGEMEALVSNLEKTFVIDLTGVYPVTVHFHGNEVRIEPGCSEEFDLKVSMTLDTMAALANGQTGSLQAFLRGQVGVKKMWNVAALLKFLNIFIPALKIAAERGVHFGKTHRS